MKLSYRLGQIHAVADFIWNNNHSIRATARFESVFSLVDHILFVIRHYALKNAKIHAREQNECIDLSHQYTEYLGTMGYYIVFGIEADFIDVDVFVDLTICADKGYITEEIDLLDTTDEIS
jgi:hypothetical protein